MTLTLAKNGHQSINRSNVELGIGISTNLQQTHPVFTHTIVSKGDLLGHVVALKKRGTCNKFYCCHWSNDPHKNKKK